MIKLTRFLEIGLFNVKYKSEKKLHKEYNGIDWGDNSEIEKAIDIDDNKNDDKKNL